MTSIDHWEMMVACVGQWLIWFFNHDKSLLIFNSDDQLIGNVGRGWVKLIPVQIATPLLEDSLMTEIAREIQLLQKQTDTFDKHYVNQGISVEIF